MCRSSNFFQFVSHQEKLRLLSGCYIMVGNTRGGISFYKSPCVLAEVGRASRGSMDIHMSYLTHNHWITIFEAISRNTLDAEGGTAQFLMEDRKEADINPLSGEEPVNTPFKRPWFQSGGFKMDTRDRDNPSTA